MSLFLTLLFSYQYSISHQSHTIGTTCAVFSWMTGLILLVTWTWWQSQLAFYRSLIVYTPHRCHKLSAVLVEGGGGGGWGVGGGLNLQPNFQKGGLDRTSVFRGGLLGKRGVTFFRGGWNSCRFKGGLFLRGRGWYLNAYYVPPVKFCQANSDFSVLVSLLFGLFLVYICM